MAVMAQVTPQLVKELRERTQAGMSDCKNALVEAEADIDKAVEIILKKGLAKSAKRAGAVATEGEIRARLAADGRWGVLVEVNIQTDFAARNEDFKNFVGSVLEVAASAKAHEDLGVKPCPGTDKTVSQARDELIARIGEKIDVRRFARVELAAPAGRVHSYVHMNGKIGVLLEVAAETPEVAAHEAFLKFVDDTAMQIAAMSPVYVQRGEVPAEVLAKQREIYEAQVREEGKPEKAWPKIVDGKIAKWHTEVCLLDQDSVIESQKSVDQVRADAAKAAGGNVKPIRFVRFQLGEGLAKKQDDFAEEAKRMAGSG
jgi:elongation factor Ts